jgi:UDP-glucose 4-epimerase
MGISKAMMEKIATSKTRLRSCGDTIIAVTRYGNVMCSRGSVIPLFISQINKDQPLTVTDPNMTRFMMSLDDAINLVLFAFQNAKGGELFIQKAPASTIANLAETVRELFGGKEEIRYIGTRHGEKLCESLLTREEMAKAIDLNDYYMVPLDTRDLNYSNYFSNGQECVSKSEDYTSHNTRRLSREELKDLLLSLEYVQKALKGGGSGEGY